MPGLKIRSFQGALFILGVLFLTHCQQSEPRVEQPGEEEAARVIALGDSAARLLIQNLKSALLEAMQEGGPLNAITVCNVKAQPLTRESGSKLPQVLEIKRTTFRYRNPRNAPDELEKQALQFFASQLQKGEALPPYYVQKVVRDRRVEYRYYKPLVVQPLCVNCHGDPGKMSAELLEKLHQLYPEDKATGYQVGDFRGVVRVSLQLPPAGREG